jgi:hypothetical protein
VAKGYDRPLAKDLKIVHERVQTAPWPRRSASEKRSAADARADARWRANETHPGRDALIVACKHGALAVPVLHRKSRPRHSKTTPATRWKPPTRSPPAPNGGIDFENEWLERYGKFRRYFGGTGTANGRRYDVVKIELPSGEKKTVYFDITENWDK